MDVEKILGVFEELIEEEKTFGVQSILTNIVNYTNSENFEKVDLHLKNLKEYSKGSIVNSYSFSKMKILTKVGGEDLFGFYLYENISEILSTEVSKVKKDLAKETSRRKQLLEAMRTNAKNLEDINFKSYYNNLEGFELGLIIPEDETNLKDVEGYIKDLRFILKTINELLGANQTEPKIYSVSSSSIGIFLVVNYSTSKCLLDLAKKVLEIYGKVYEIKELKLKYTELLNEEPKHLDSKIKSIVSEEKKKIVEEVVSKYTKKADNGKKEELKKGVESILDKIVDLYDKGIVIEATAPKIKPEKKGKKKKTVVQSEKPNVVSKISSKISRTSENISESEEQPVELNDYEKPKTEEKKKKKIKPKKKKPVAKSKKSSPVKKEIKKEKKKETTKKKEVKKSVAKKKPVKAVKKTKKPAKKPNKKIKIKKDNIY